MPRLVSWFACASLLLSPVICAPFSPNAPVIARNILAKRAEPETGDDFPDTEPHPNNLDKVETAFIDALQLASYALGNLGGDDNTIFTHYFNEVNKDTVKNVFATIYGSSDPGAEPIGNDLLSHILVQTQDADGKCGGRTLAYMNDFDTDKPYIVLCPSAFNKKAVTPLKGAPNPSDNPDDLKFYIDCDDLKTNGHVSYLMNFLGATLLHEYLHYDNLIKPSVFFLPVVDQPKGYGPVNVYNNLDKTLALTNADSYVYFALEVLWTAQCKTSFDAPRAGIDDADPDCSGNICDSTAQSSTPPAPPPPKNRL